MTIKTILACLTSESGADSLLIAARTLARRHDAHLIGLHVLETVMVYPGITVPIPDNVLESLREAQRHRSKAFKAVFGQHTRIEEFVSEWRELRGEPDNVVDQMVDCARSADLVIMSAAQGDEDDAAQRRRIEAVIRQAGRPVLVIPQGFSGDDLGSSVLIGWNGSRQAARAAHDVLTLLMPGDSAHIVHANDDGRDGVEDHITKDLAKTLSRHGIETTVVNRTWEHGSVAEALNKEAFEKGCDMIAIGAFGHSRAYDLIIGAATRGLLRQSDLPVLFSR